MSGTPQRIPFNQSKNAIIYPPDPYNSMRQKKVTAFRYHSNFFYKNSINSSSTVISVRVHSMFCYVSTRRICHVLWFRQFSLSICFMEMTFLHRYTLVHCSSIVRLPTNHTTFLKYSNNKSLKL